MKRTKRNLPFSALVLLVTMFFMVSSVATARDFYQMKIYTVKDKAQEAKTALPTIQPTQGTHAQEAQSDGSPWIFMLLIHPQQINNHRFLYPGVSYVQYGTNAPEPP